MHTRLAESLQPPLAPAGSCARRTCPNKASLKYNCGLCWEQPCLRAHINEAPDRPYSCGTTNCHTCNPYQADAGLNSQCRVCGIPHSAHYHKDCEAKLRDRYAPAIAIERGSHVESSLRRPMPLETLKALFKVDTAYHGKKPSPRVSMMAGVGSAAPEPHITTATNHTGRLRRKAAFSKA